MYLVLCLLFEQLRQIIQPLLNKFSGDAPARKFHDIDLQRPSCFIEAMTSFQQLIDIVKKLRGPNGCPWDKEQTHESLTPYAIEEAHELEEAITRGDTENLKEELGDLLFQSVLHAEVARQNGDFDIDDVIKHLNNKMVSRHPHVFSTTEVKDTKEVVQNWEEIKAQEKDSDPFDIPKSFPSLLRAHKIGKRTRKMDFDWNTSQEVMKKVNEELSELTQAIQSEDKNHIEEEMGDLLFTISQLARHLNLDAEKSLRLANNKFIGRFQAMLEAKPDFENLSREDKEKLWHSVKLSLAKGD